MKPLVFWIGNVIVAMSLLIVCCKDPTPAWEVENPIKELPQPPLGIRSKQPIKPPTPERVRLGRWLFYDRRLSDQNLSCADCHRPENAFSDPKPGSTSQSGEIIRKVPALINGAAWAASPFFFWDGRADSIEASIEDSIHKGNTYKEMIHTFKSIKGYRKYLKEAFGTEEITEERVARAIADYVRTRMSGNSPWDRWKNGDPKAVTKTDMEGEALFFNKAGCNQCHLGQNFTDSLFHNLGIGWNPKLQKFKDEGRSVVTTKEADKGAFKTPTLRDVSKHGPYMHDGSLKTLLDVVKYYNNGGHPNPNRDPRIKPLNLTEEEINALVRFMETLNGEGYQDTPPTRLPQ